MFYFLLVIYLLACIIMIVAVLMHESKGGGLASAFGGGGMDSAFGAGIGRKINRFTIGAVIVFILLSVVLGKMWSKAAPPPAPAATTVSSETGEQKAGEQAPAGENTPTPNDDTGGESK